MMTTKDVDLVILEQRMQTTTTPIWLSIILQMQTAASYAGELPWSSVLFRMHAVVKRFLLLGVGVGGAGR